MIQQFLTIMGFVVVAFIEPAHDPPAEGPRPVEDQKVVARVNGKPVHEEQLQAEIAAGLRKFSRFGRRREDPELIKRLRERALERVVGEELIIQESQKLSIEDLDEQVELKLQALRRKHGTPARLDDYLRRNGLTLDGVILSYKAQVKVDAYLKQQGISDPPIPETRIREAYEQHPESYAREARIQVSHILIAVDPQGGADGDKEARQRAEQVRMELAGGRDFAELAKAHSDCNSAAAGGSLGYVKRGYMPESFERAAFAMEKDAVSDIVKTEFGYHIIKVTDVEPGGVAPFENVRDFIEKYLQEQESKKRLAAHVTDLKNRANIEIVE